MYESRTDYAARPATAPFTGGLPIPYVRASLGARTIAYLLDILFILGFTTLLTLAITVIGIVTFGLGWTLFAVLPASGIIYSAITVGGRRQSTIGQRMMGLRVVAPESGAPVDIVSAAVPRAALLRGGLDLPALVRGRGLRAGPLRPSPRA